ncbi:unnamed protein product [Porites lobata]|uniref:Sulfotransferase domain-containing protein n=1 Tax=Porites lobata TaxID=104759 RepID=A0ABN8RRS7_9CNID|nr:unnamed protein product [Porites lobata]
MSHLDHAIGNNSAALVVPNFWNDHVLGWWKHKDDRNILFLKYKDLHTIMLRYLDLAAVEFFQLI